MAQRTKSVTFIRHANTGKAANDLDRQLTEKGLQQAAARREALGQPKFDMVIASAANRARATAAIVAGINVDEVVGFDALYLPPVDSADRKAIDGMFERLAYAPLRAYREADETGALIRYGYKGAEFIYSTIDCDGIDDILVGGHAVLLNSIVAHMAEGDTDLLLDSCLGEAEGIRVTLYDGTVAIVELVQ